MPNDEHSSWTGIPPLFNLARSAHATLFHGTVWPWDALLGIESYIRALLEASGGPAILSVVPEGATIEGDVWIGPDCRIEPGVLICGPAWIGSGCEIRQGAYLRGAVLAGSGAILGHCSEFKNCVLLEGAQAPHFNYVGDSLLGLDAHIGAGVILSNFRLDKAPVKVVAAPGAPPLARIETGLQKFGAILGDHCEVGCNSVLNPGTVLGERCSVMPVSRVQGLWPAGSRIGGANEGIKTGLQDGRMHRNVFRA